MAMPPTQIEWPDTAPAFGDYTPSTGARAVLAVSRTTFLGRGKARRVLGRIFRSLHSGPVDTQLWGVPVRLYPDGNVSERKALFSPAHFNRNELKAVVGRLGEPGSVFVDIGANAGLFSLFAARHAAAGVTIVAFEPHPGLFRRMAFNLRPQALGRAAGETDLRLRQMALGAQAGTVLLRSAADELGSGHIVKAADAAERDIQVPMQTLNQVLEDEGISHISVMKIDVEGYEDQVLPPFFAAAPKALWPRALIIEHLCRQDWSKDCIRDCQDRGYDVTVLSKSNSLLTLDRDFPSMREPDAGRGLTT